MSKVEKRGSYRDHKTAISSLNIGRDTGVIFVCGTSDFLLNRSLERIRANAGKAGLPYFSQEATATNETTIMQMGSQASLFDPASVFVLRRVEQAKALPNLLKALPANNLANLIVLAYKGEGPPQPLKLELARLKAKSVPCFQPWPNEVGDIVMALANDMNLKLKNDALQLLLEMNGTDLVTHFHEVSKLSLIFADAKTPIGRDDVAPHLGFLREDDAFHLDRLLLQRQWNHAQALLANLIERGEKGLAIVGILAGHCRNVLKIADARSHGVSQGDMATHIKLPPYLLKTYLPLVSPSVDVKPYRDALELCRQADTLLKSTRVSESLLVAQIIDGLAAR